jgi:hypothetical protein
MLAAVFRDVHLGALVLATALACFGCKARAPQAPPVAAVAPPRAHPADAHAAATRLGPDSLLFAVSDDVEALFEAIDRDGIAHRFADEWERAVYEIVRETGVNPLSLDGLAELGIDTQGEVGVAVTGGRRPVGVVFFSLVSSERFKTVLYRELRERPQVVEGVVMVGDRDWTIAIDGTTVMVFLGPGAEREARRAARRDVESSLAHRRAFRVAMRENHGSALIRGYLDARGVGYLPAGLDPRWGGVTYGTAVKRVEAAERSALAEARAHGASAEELVGIDDLHAEAQEELRSDFAASLTRRLLGDVEGAALALDLSPSGWNLRLAVDTDDASAIKRALSRPAPSARLIRAFDRAPLGMVAVGLDGEQALTMARAAGLSPLIAMRETLAQVVGGDLPAVEGIFTGAFGVAVLPPDGDVATLGLDAFGVAGVLELGDAAAARVLLDRAAEAQERLTRNEQGWSLLLPDLPKLELRVTADALIAASDERLVARLTSGETGGFEPTGALRGTADPGFSGVVSFAAGLPILLERRGSAMWLADSPAPMADRGDAPKSKAYLDKLAQLQQVDDQLGEQMVAAQRERTRQTFDALAPLGQVVATLRHTPHGLTLSIDHRTDGTPLVDIVADLQALERDGDGLEAERLRALWARRDEVAAELGAIEARERTPR